MARKKKTDGMNGRIFIRCSGGLPSCEYGFGDDRLSVVIERNGGINEMHYIMEEDVGKKRLRPNRTPLPILSREGAPDNHPPGMYGPPVRFISTHRDGPNVYHFPEELSLAPFGINGFSRQYGYRYGYRFAVNFPETVFYFGNDNPRREELVIMVFKSGICPGEWSSDYWMDKGDSDLLKHRDYQAYRKMFLQTASWTDFAPEERANVLCTAGKVSHRGKERSLYLGIAGENGAVLQETKNGWLIRNSWDSAKDGVRHAYLVLAENRSELFERMEKLRRNPEKPWKRQTGRFEKIAKNIPELHIPSVSPAEEFCRSAPLFNEAMTFDKTKKTQAIRASLCGYGYFPGWDTTLPARGFALWNQFMTAERLLRYDSEIVTPDNTWIVAAHDCASAARNLRFLKEFFPEIERAMTERISACDNTGMYPCGSYGADDPKQIGIEGAVTTPDGMGWWYNACRLTENTCRRLGRENLAERLKEISDRIENNFIPTFYDTDTGFLTGAVDWSSRKPNRNFQNVVTAAMEGPFGPHLLREKTVDIAAFIRNQLAHPYLRSAVPFWDNSSEMWTSCIMQQHSFHEGETLRFGGQDKELVRQLNCAMRLFEKFKTAIETVNLTDLPGNYHQERKWQAFGASAWYTLILQSVIGIERDWGGITYRPADLPVDAEILGWKQGKVTWDVAVSGKGRWVESIKLDGRELRGSYKTTSAVFRKAGKHRLEIRRGTAAPELPVLVRAPQVDVAGVDCFRNGTEVLLAGNARTPVWLYAPGKIEVTLNGRKVNPKPFGKNGFVSIDILVEEKAHLRIAVL